ncbi:hypothetical protein AB0H58_31375 [Nocardia neocaledoniensis]|uniref:TRADD-N-associated membrane domain-containing protein n=1 Tax=Nocardia neocaledoniensis TaxID=236511 RepID=UPI00341199F1
MADSSVKFEAAEELYRKRLQRIRRFSPAFFLPMVGFVAIFSYLGYFDERTTVLIAGTLVVMVTMLQTLTKAATRSFEEDRKLQMTSRQVEQAVEEVAGPDDLWGLMKVNRRQMEQYDVQARAQGRSSHISSLIAMGAGLVIVGFGLAIAVTADDSATKYSAAIVAAVGTATGGYIARTFIRVNTAAQHHVRYYFEQPLVQSYLLTAERIADRLPERERGVQYEQIVAAALQQAGMVPQLREPAAADPEPEPEPDPAEDPTQADGEPAVDVGKE